MTDKAEEDQKKKQDENKDLVIEATFKNAREASIYLDNVQVAKRIGVITEETEKQIADCKKSIKTELKSNQELTAKNEDLKKKVQELEAQKL